MREATNYYSCESITKEDSDIGMEDRRAREELPRISKAASGVVLMHGTVRFRPDQLLHKKQWPHGSEHLSYSDSAE